MEASTSCCNATRADRRSGEGMAGVELAFVSDFMDVTWVICNAAGVMGGKITRPLVKGVRDETSSFRFLLGVSVAATSSTSSEGRCSIVETSRCFLIDSRVGRSRSGFLDDRRGVRGFWSDWPALCSSRKESYETILFHFFGLKSDSRTPLTVRRALLKSLACKHDACRALSRVTSLLFSLEHQDVSKECYLKPGIIHCLDTRYAQIAGKPVANSARWCPEPCFVRALARGTSFLAEKRVSSFTQTRCSCSSSTLVNMVIVRRKLEERIVTSSDHPVIRHIF